MPINPVEGAGPFTFSNSETLSPGEKYYLDFQEMEYKGRKRWFKPLLPLDQCQITNRNTQNSVDVTYNNKFTGFVLPSSVEGFDRQGIVSVEVENSGDTDISPGEIRVEVLKEPYSGDDAALERKKRGKLARILRSKIGFEL